MYDNDASIMIVPNSIANHLISGTLQFYEWVFHVMHKNTRVQSTFSVHTVQVAFTWMVLKANPSYT